MQPPAQQPLGFWTVRAGEAIRTRTRSRLAEAGVTQPEWWVLHQLSLHADGRTEAQLVDQLGPNDTDEAIELALSDLVDKGWVEHRGDRLASTAEGTARFERAAVIQGELGDERRQGISDVAYATTIEVLQRTIRNVGGDAWHW